MKHFAVSVPDFVWVIEACCSLLQLQYPRELILQRFAAPHDNASVTAALAELGIATQSRKLKTTKLGLESFPLLVWLKDDAELHPALILRAEADKVLLVQPGDKEPRTLPLSELAERSHGAYLLLTTQVQNGTDPDAYLAWVLAQPGTAPTIISNKLGLRGPSYAVRSNCSSSLVALRAGCQAILSDESKHALVGSATLFPNESIGYIHQPGLNFSSDGHIRAFDAAADGTVGAEGVALLLLKAAVEDGDHITPSASIGPR